MQQCAQYSSNILGNGLMVALTAHVQNLKAIQTAYQIGVQTKTFPTMDSSYQFVNITGEFIKDLTMNLLNTLESI